MGSHFAVTSLRMGAGFLIWALHFGAVYVYTALICARPATDTEWLGMRVLVLGIVCMSAVAIAAQLAVMWKALRGSWYAQAHQAAQPFTAWISAAVGAFGLLAVLWVTLPIIWLRSCPS